MRAFLCGAIIVVCSVLAPLTDMKADDKKQGAVKVTVLGADGKPLKDAKVSQVSVGTVYTDGTAVPDAGKGKVVLVHATDAKGNDGYTVTFVPDGKESGVTTQLGPQIRPYNAYEQAESSQGNPETYEKNYNEFKRSIAETERVADEAQAAIDQWADANDLPRQTRKQVGKQLKAANAVGAENQNKEAVELLKAYEAKLKYVDDIRDAVKEHKERLAGLPVPEKKTTMLPGTCPDGQSGGLLAGMLNSATGTSSFQGICDEDPEKDNKDRRHGGETHGKD